MRKIIIAIVVLLTNSACGNKMLSQTLGINTKAPDEFLVISNPPLVIPDKFILVDPKDIATDYSKNKEVQQNRTLSNAEQNILNQINEKINNSN